MDQYDLEIKCRRAKNGDELALSQLINLYLPTAKDAINKFSQSGLDLWELESACMTGLYQAIRLYDANKGNFLSLLRLCVRHRMIERLRVLKRHVLIPLNEEAEDKVDTAAASDFEDVETYVVYGVAGELLDESEQAIYELYLRDYPVNYIATILQLHRVTVSKKLAHIRKKLEDTDLHER